MNLKGRGLKLFYENTRRIILCTKPSFLHHHHSFRSKIFLSEEKVLHPVRFKIERDLNPIRTQILKISGIVSGSKRIIISPVLLDDAGELLWADLLGPFKHHMFEDMGNTRFTPGLVSGSHTVPDLKGDQGRLVIFKEDYL
jgi:hypothetical protein